MVRRRDLVVAIRLDALHRVVRVVVELVQHLLIHFVVDGHGFAAREQAVRTPVLRLLEPRVLTDLVDAVALLWVGAQNLGHEVSAVL